MSANKQVSRQYTDEETGEVHTFRHEEPIAVNRRRGKPGLADEKFVMVFTERLAGARLTGLQYSTLLLLSGQINLETGVVDYRVSELAGKLSSSQPNVSRVLTDLDRLGLVTRLARSRLRINPLYLWRGSIGDRRNRIINFNDELRPE